MSGTSSNNVRAWVDVTDLAAWTGNYTGIQRVSWNLVRRWAGETSNFRFFVYNDITHQFSETSVNAIGEARRRLPYRDVPDAIRRLVPTWLRVVLWTTYFGFARATSRLRKSRAAAQPTFQSGDLILELGASWLYPTIQPRLRALKAVGVKLGHFVHDVIPVLQPQLFEPDVGRLIASHLIGVLESADLILVSSDATRSDVLEICRRRGVEPPIVEAVRLGDTLIDEEPSESVAGVAAPFLLSVGTVEVRKNHALLYQVYKLAAEKGVDLPPLVIAGRAGWLTADIVYVIQHDPAVRHKIEILHNVSDRQLSWLYEHCLITVYPSICEGWGLPVAEALSYGKIALASTSPSLREIGGGLVEYFSPFDARRCLALIETYLDEQRRRLKEKEIRRRYTRVSWDQTFEQVSRVVERLGVQSDGA